MGQYAGAHDLRNLLSVADKLRLLTDDTLCRGDRSLNLIAAEALETRAEWLAAALPAESHAPDVVPAPRAPVNLNLIV